MEWLENLRLVAQEENWTKQEKAKHLATQAIDKLEIPMVVKVALQNMGYLEALYNMSPEQIDYLIANAKEVIDFLEEE